MSTKRIIRLMLLVFSLSLGMAAQSSSQTPPDTTQTPPSSTPDTSPAPAFGQTAPVLNPENPPVTGLDEPSLDLRSSSRSFISPALQVSESADTNGDNQLDYHGLQSITRVIGAFDLQKFWSKSDLFLEYLGGGAFYNNPSDIRQLEAVGFEGVTRWRTGTMAIRDSFTYLPEGSFEIGTFGGAPGFGIANGGGTGFAGGGIPGAHPFGSGLFGAVGDVPRLANTAILDAVQAVSPVAAITVAAGFSDAHFFDPTHLLINSDQFTFEAGYSHLFRRHDQLGLVYAFQLIQFPQNTGGQIYVNIVNLRWSHTITGRLNLIVGAGPEYISLEEGGYESYLSLSARVQLRYKMGHASILASYEKFVSPGSGLYAGADVQTARLGYNRPLGRTWEFFGDLGFSHNAKIQGGGISANSYNDMYVSTIFRKHLGRTYEFIAAYRFGEDIFSSYTCAPDASCGRSAQRQSGSVGLEWHPKPTRIE